MDSNFPKDLVLFIYLYSKRKVFEIIRRLVINTVVKARDKSIPYPFNSHHPRETL